MQITPLAAKVNNINTAGNRSNVGRATALYIMSTAADTITNHTTSASFQIAPNSPIVLFKEQDDEVYSGATTTHFTKITYPRG
jgi:transglutaminase/protease-like cytokinesis protein 3